MCWICFRQADLPPIEPGEDRSGPEVLDFEEWQGSGARSCKQLKGPNLMFGRTHGCKQSIRDMDQIACGRDVTVHFHLYAVQFTQ